MQFKFVSDKKNATEHWQECERNKLPYIEVIYFSEKYSTIFYDVTNLNVDLQKISDSLKTLYLDYLEFLQLTDSFFDDYKDQYYYMNFLVKKEHAEDLADYLFDYIKNKFIEK